MADTLALEKLFDDVAERFSEEDGEDAIPMFFGWREVPRQLDGKPRIVWVPGDDPSGNAGAIKGARFPGGNPRSIASLDELFTVYIHGSDPEEPENERAQWKAARLAFDTWYRAIYLAAHGNVSIVSLSWVNAKRERRHGATLKVVGAILAMIPDREFAATDLDVGAEITVNLETNDSPPPGTDIVEIEPP